MNFERKNPVLRSPEFVGVTFFPPLPIHQLGSVTEVGLITLLLKQNFIFFLFNAISFSICKEL